MREIKKSFSLHFLVIAMVFSLIAIVTGIFVFNQLFFVTAGIAVACLIASGVFYYQSKPEKAKIDIVEEGHSLTWG